MSSSCSAAKHPRRSAKAADLFQAGLAPRIVVSGGGDATIIRRYLIQDGVPADRITIEDRSTTTWENALFVAPLLRSHSARRVLLVTSWFHTRRAVGTFRSAAGDIRFSPVAAEYSWAAYTSPWWEQTKDVCREYAKIGAYLVPARRLALRRSGRLRRLAIDHVTMLIKVR